MTSAPTSSLQLPLKPKIFLFVGRPGSGKSFAIKSLLYSYFKARIFKFGYAFVATAFNHDYNFLPDKFVDEKYSDKKLEAYINALRKIKEQKGDVPPNFLILDDLIGKIHFYSDEVQHFLSTFRHTNTYVFITSQYIGSKGSSTALREYANFVFLWRSNSGSAVDLLYHAFGKYSNERQRKLFDNVDQFVDLLMQATDPNADGGIHKHRCLLLINNPEQSPEFLFFKAALVPEFRVKP
jgi:hypothetical protein